MIKSPRSFRLRKQIDVIWSVPSQKIEGEGLIFNISRTGMLFVTDKLFDPSEKLTMCFKAAQVPSFPSKGELVWFRKVGKGGAQHQCGIRFADGAIQNPPWVKWMEENILKLADTGDNKILDRILNEGQ